MTATSLDSIEAIRAALSPGTERDPAAYAIDGVSPAAAFEPPNRQEVAALLRLATDGALAVVPQCGRTALTFGRPLDAYDIALDMRGLRRTVEYVPDDLTVTVEAGRRLGALQAELAEHGQYLSVDPPPDDDVSIGGLLATARSGPWRGHVPAARDLILGMEVVAASGDLVHSGGRVVKNVTGYDLQRLYTGALGAFGVIVEATFKVAPLPASSRTLFAPAPTLSAAAATAHRAWDASPALRALSVLTSRAAVGCGLPNRPGVLIEVAGTTASVERSARDLGGALTLEEAPASSWTTLRRLHGASPAVDEETTVLRAGVPPATLGEMLEALDAAEAVAWCNLAAGAAIGRFAVAEADTVAALRRTAEQRGGFLVVEAAPAALRHTVPPEGGDAVLLRALRDRFDPMRTVNRGRWGATL